MLGHTTSMKSSEANAVHFSAEGSEAKRAMVIAGAAGGSVFRGGSGRSVYRLRICFGGGEFDDDVV